MHATLKNAKLDTLSIPLISLIEIITVTNVCFGSDKRTARSSGRRTPSGVTTSTMTRRWRLNLATNSLLSMDTTSVTERENCVAETVAGKEELETGTRIVLELCIVVSILSGYTIKFISGVFNQNNCRYFLVDTFLLQVLNKYVCRMAISVKLLNRIERYVSDKIVFL